MALRFPESTGLLPAQDLETGHDWRDWARASGTKRRTWRSALDLSQIHWYDIQTTATKDEASARGARHPVCDT